MTPSATSSSTAAKALKVGPDDGDDFGPVINERQIANMLAARGGAGAKAAQVLTGGERLTDPAHAKGFYLAPTVIEDAGADADISRTSCSARSRASIASAASTGRSRSPTIRPTD